MHCFHIIRIAIFISVFRKTNRYIIFLIFFKITYLWYFMFIELAWKTRASSFISSHLEPSPRHLGRYVNWTRKLNRGNMKETFRFWARSCTAIFACRATWTDFSISFRLKSHQFSCLHEFSIILFIFPSALPSADSTRTLVSEYIVEASGVFMADRQHMAIYWNPLNYFYTMLYDTLLCTRQPWIQISPAIYISSRRKHIKIHTRFSDIFF